MPKYDGPVVIAQDVRRELGVTNTDLWNAVRRLGIPKLVRREVDPQRVCIPLEDVERLRSALAHRRRTPEQLAAAEERQRERYNAWAKAHRKAKREGLALLSPLSPRPGREDPRPTEEPEPSHFGIVPDPTLGISPHLVALETVAERTRVPVKALLREMSSGDLERVGGYQVVHISWLPTLERAAARWLERHNARKRLKALSREGPYVPHVPEPSPAEVERHPANRAPSAPASPPAAGGVPHSPRHAFGAVRGGQRPPRRPS